MTEQKKPAAKRQPKGEPIVRTNDQGAWWCPICDHSNESKVAICGGCGVTRDGDKVVKA